MKLTDKLDDPFPQDLQNNITQKLLELESWHNYLYWPLHNTLHCALSTLQVSVYSDNGTTYFYNPDEQLSSQLTTGVVSHIFRLTGLSGFVGLAKVYSSQLKHQNIANWATVQVSGGSILLPNWSAYSGTPSQIVAMKVTLPLIFLCLFLSSSSSSSSSNHTLAIRSGLVLLEPTRKMR